MIYPNVVFFHSKLWDYQRVPNLQSELHILFLKSREISRETRDLPPKRIVRFAAQVVNLKRELSEQGDSIEDDKRAKGKGREGSGQAVRVQILSDFFIWVLVEFMDNKL